MIKPITKNMILKWKKRSISLRKKGSAILLARQDSIALTPVAWAALISLSFLLIDQINNINLLIMSLLLFTLLNIIALIDIEYFIIADIPLYCLIIITVIYLFYVNNDVLLEHFVAGVIGFIFIKIISIFYCHVRKIEAIGSGDAKLFAFAGLCLGVDGLAGTLFYSIISAIITSIIALRSGNLKTINDPIPFGPHLALGIWLVWVLGPVQIG
jgi:leader peptidase (prepilin peptidase)/N-methyltransferase